MRGWLRWLLRRRRDVPSPHLPPPAAVLDAIAAVSYTVACLQCSMTIAVHYSSALDTIVIRHPVKHELGPAADALAEVVMEELERHVLVADYGEARPVHIMVSR